MKDAKKLELINGKIAELQKVQKQLENEYVESLSKDIAKLLLKKRMFSIEKSIILNKIDAVINKLKLDESEKTK